MNKMNPQTPKENLTQIERRKALAIAYEKVWSILANRNRIEILFKLCEGEQNWSDLMFSLQINPRSLSSHLKFLQDYEIVNKNDKKYHLTELGKEICELNFFKPEYLSFDLS